jgi:hypothetical protein
MDPWSEHLGPHQTRARIAPARQQEHDPSPPVPTDAVVPVAQVVYTVVLDTLNASINIERMAKQQQGVMDQLLTRAVDKEHVVEVLHKVATGSEEDLKAFCTIGQRTTLHSLMTLSSEATTRVRCFDVLHERV